ncbi:MAG TPA: hypothetical protein VHR27_12295 [Blastocatellia bacterium]|jgi:hypothetical protein|nr:hypothetical protein [Blastocatellia bacterium]
MTKAGKQTGQKEQGRHFFVFLCPFCLYYFHPYIIHRIIKESVCGHYKHLSALGKSLRQSPQMRVIERAAARGAAAYARGIA